MKKTIVLLTIVLALLAAPVFAEVTASGEANFAWMFNADDYEEQIDTNLVDINLGGTVGDYTSIYAEIEAEYDTDGFLSAGAGSDNVYLNQMTITQDVTGALGIDAGVTVAITVGIDDFDPMEYNDMAYGDFDLDGELNPGTVMTKLSLGMADMLTVDVAMYEEYKIGVNAYGNVADMADVSVYYMKDFTTSAWDAASYVPADAEDAYVLGFNTGVMVMDGVKVGAGYEMGAWDTSTDFDSFSMYGISVVYTGVDALELTLGTNTYVYEDSDFMEDTSYRLAVDYMINDMISVNAAMGANLSNVDTAGDDVDFADAVVYEVGAKAVVDGLTYQAGYTLDSDNEAYAGGFMDGADRAGNFYLRMGASF